LGLDIIEEQILANEPEPVINTALTSNNEIKNEIILND